MISVFPLMILPFAFYNAVIVGAAGGVASLGRDILSLSMPSGTVWTLSFGDLLVAVALMLLLAGIFRATARNTGSLLGHMLSVLVFIGFLAEFLLVKGAATQVFFFLTMIAFVDAAGGLAVSIRSAPRDISIGL